MFVVYQNYCALHQGQVHSTRLQVSMWFAVIQIIALGMVDDQASISSEQ